MRTFIVIAYCLLCFKLPSAYSQLPSRDLQITFIANEGFLLKSPTKKVLIDALFTEGYGAFTVPAPETLTDIKDAKPPFDSIHLYMLTHYHRDHCDPVSINEYLSKHKDVRFVTNKPAIVFIDGWCFGFIAKKKQFDLLTPEINHCVSQTIHDIPVKAFGLKHLSFFNKDSIDLEENMFNVSYLVEMDGIKIFHSGDIKMNAFQDYVAKNGKWTDSIDVAFLYYGLFNSGESDVEYILATLHPKYIVMMHVPAKKIDEWAEKTEVLKKKYPRIIFLKKSMDMQKITITENKIP